MTETNNIQWKKIESSAHNFKETKALVGILIDTPKNAFQGNDFLIEKENGDRILVFGKTALQSKLNNLPMGTRVKIEYLGERKSDKTGRLYEDYDVYIENSISQNIQQKEQILK